MNNQQRATMQMALEALHNTSNALLFVSADGYSVSKMAADAYDDAEKAITALREALAQPQGEWVVDVRAKVLPVIGMVWDKTMNIDDALDQIDVLYTTPPREAFDCCVYQQKDGAVITSYDNQAQFEQMLTKSPAVVKYVEAFRIETLEKAAQRCEELSNEVDINEWHTALDCAAAIRSMK